MFNTSIERARRGLRIAGLLVVASSLSACSGAHLYNPENDKTATAAKEASDTLDLTAVVAQERANQARLLQHELATISDFAVTRRNIELQALLEIRKKDNKVDVKPLSSKLNQFVGDRLTELDVKTPSAVLDRFDEYVAKEENLATAGMFLTLQLGIAPPVCAAKAATDFTVTNALVEKFRGRAVKLGKDPNTLSSGDVKDALENFGSFCSLYQEASRKLYDSSAKIQVLMDEWTAAREELVTQQQKADDAKGTYKAALTEYQKAHKAASASGAEEDLEKVRKKFSDLSDALTALSEAAPLQKSAAAEAKIEKIDLLLQAAATGQLDEAALETADERTKGALAVVAQLPSFAARIREISALSSAPPVTALLFEKQRLLALKFSADRAIERTRQRIGLIEQKILAFVEEVRALNKSRQYITFALERNGGTPITPEDLKVTQKPTVRRYTVMAIASYLNSFTGPRRLKHETEYRLIDVNHAEVLDQSETSLKLWENAVKQPVTALAAYHATGVKNEDFIELLKAAGLFAIAAGVE